MKHKKLLMILSLITSTLAFENSFGSILFSDDFQSDLTKWNTNSTGVIVTDPLLSGEHALSFTNIDHNFILSRNSFTSTNGVFNLSYDYLGRTIDDKTGGGYVGIKNQAGTIWLSGDGSMSTPNRNLDNSQWNHISFSFTSSSAFQLKLEQWEEKSDKSGTALFKNLVLTGDSDVTAVPVTGSVWLMMTGLFSLLGLNRRKSKIEA